jgi:hypothetical protein
MMWRIVHGYWEASEAGRYRQPGRDHCDQRLVGHGVVQSHS